MNQNKYRYKTGIRPLPMLAIYEEINKNAFSETFKNEFGNWKESGNHVWTTGAYFIFLNNEVISYKFDEIANLIWLLRYKNIDLVIYLDQKWNEVIQKYYKDELISI